MNNVFRTFMGVSIVLLWTVAVTHAADPPSGTLTETNTVLNYTGGPYTGANASNNVNDEPDCDLVPGTCDDYQLFVDLPPTYFVDNPDHVITIVISWPNDANDFDLYVQNPNTGNSVTTAATSGDPEIAVIDPVNLTEYRVRNLVFAAVNETFSATITLGPRPPSGTGVGTYLASEDIFTCDRHMSGQGPVFSHDQDGEPAVKVSKDGVAWVGAISGVPAGNAMWKMTDNCAQEYTYKDLTDLGVGGGDIDIEIAPERNALGNYNIYMSSLWLGNLTSVSSFDGGNTFAAVVISDPTPVNDRQWNAAYGDLTSYLSWRTLNAGNQLLIARSDDGGLTYGPPIPVYDDIVGTTLATQLGNLATDQRPVPAGTLPLTAGPDGEGNVYHGWILTTQDASGGHKIYVSVSKDFGITWVSKEVYQAPTGGALDFTFSWLAVDQIGNVYTTWSDGHDIFYSFSTDQADTWSQPIRVNSGGDTKTSIFPMVEAGTEGRIVFGWYGSQGDDVNDTSNQWHFFHSRCNNALDTNPVFEGTRTSNFVVKTGVVCLDGLSCSGNRELLELAEIAIDPTDGSSYVTHATSNVNGTYLSRQVAGKSAVAGATIVDRSLTCPTTENNCLAIEPPPGDPCNPPGVLVLTDDAGDFDPTLGNTSYDILKVEMADPGEGANKDLVVTMTIAELDPSNLPPSSVWRVLWDNPSDGERYFVSMLTCDVTQVPTFDYGFIDENDIQTSLGDADEGSVSSDGTIQIRVSTALVGNPQIGHVLGSVEGTARLFLGAQCTGLITPIDEALNGSYTLACTPVSTTISSIEVNETDAGLQLSWSAETSGDLVGWNVYRSLHEEGPWARLNGSAIPAERSGQYAYVDSEKLTGKVFYRLGAISTDGSEQQLRITSYEFGRSVFSFALAGPNPMRSSTALSYSIGEKVPVKINVYSVDGRRVRTIVNRVQGAGRYLVAFPRQDDNGNRLASGVYLAKITAGRLQKSVRVVVVE